MPRWLQKILRYEPGISLAQWVYDRIANNWPWLLSLSGAALMTGLGAITDWSRALGPAGIGGLAIFIASLIWVTVAWGQNLRAKASERRARAEAIAKWKEAVDDFNPMMPDFHTKRFRIADLANPITNCITNKRIINCEILGPANIFFFDMDISRSGFVGCDIVVSRRDALINRGNVIVVEHGAILDSKFFACTIYLRPEMVPSFQAMGAKFVTLTGNPDIDNQPISPSAEPSG